MTFFFFGNKCMTKTSAIWQHAAKTPTNLLLLAAKQEPYKKSLTLNEKY